MPIDWPIMPEYAAAFVFGYLCGSIPFGILLTRLAGAPDLRSVGSGNIGATNVLRTGRKGLAAATLLGDMLKGTAAVLIVALLFGRLLAGWLGARRLVKASRRTSAGSTVMSKRPRVCFQASMARPTTVSVSGCTSTGRPAAWFARVTSLSGRKRLQRDSSSARRCSA